MGNSATVGKPTAHSDHLGWYIFGLEICHGVPKAYRYFSLTMFAYKKIKNVYIALREQSQPQQTYFF